MASFIDHTLLKATATSDQIRTLCGEAREHGFRAVCVNPSFVPLSRAELAGSGVLVATVCGFPLGALLPAQKAAEARASADAGADEIDMVMNIGAALEGDWALVEQDVRAVRDAVPGVVLKVIIEAAYLTDEQKTLACEAAVRAGADFVKTSTGFGPSGATPQDVALMKRTVGDRAEVKAAGGVRTREDALAMIEAGATRLGTSGGVALVAGEAHREGY